MLPDLVVASLALAAPVAAAERCTVADPTATPFNDAGLMASHRGLATMAGSSRSCARAPTETASPGPMSPMRQTEKVGFIGSSSAATEPDRWGPEAPTSADHREIENQVGEMLSPTGAWRSSRLKSSALTEGTACLLCEQTLVQVTLRTGSDQIFRGPRGGRATSS
jgi:hypothetical protein